jgi:hypothetical protein
MADIINIDNIRHVLRFKFYFPLIIQNIIIFDKALSVIYQL